MEKRTVKLTKFNKIQEELNGLAIRYEHAKENNLKEELENIKERYEELRILLRSNYAHFKKLDTYEINGIINNSEDEHQIAQLEAKKHEKKVYKSNKTYKLYYGATILLFIKKSKVYRRGINI